MTGVLQNIIDGFWNENIWLPRNTTWNDIAPGSSDHINYPNSKHLYLPIPFAFLLLALRYYLERYCFAPIGVSLGISNYVSKKAPPNSVLEKPHTLQYTKSNHKQMKRFKIQELTKQLHWTKWTVQRWLQLRYSQEQPSTLVKFCEAAWRCLYYLFIFIFGIVVLWDKPWLWDINECWTTYPHQSVDAGIWWYYIITLTSYWSQCFSQFFDVKRKDFWQMFLHHINSIVLLYVSWLSNMLRMGTVVLIIHDFSDIFLEAARVAKYSGYKKICDALTAIFTLVWIVARVFIYSFWNIRSMVNETLNIVPIYPVIYFITALLIVQLGFNVIWSYLILKIVYRSLNPRQTGGGTISSSSNYREDSKSQ